MRFRSYHKEFRKATAQLLDVFDNIIIGRYDNRGTEVERIAVPCVYAGRSRILKSLENRDKTVKLPIMSISMSGVSRDAQRAMSLHDGLTYQNSSTYNYLKNTPVPINITYQMDIYTRYQDDMDQIISNFGVFFNPDIYVVIPDPVNTGKNLKCQIVWDGNIPIQFPEEISKNEPERITAATTFTFKTWLFPGLDDTVYPEHSIHRINFNPEISTHDGIGRLQGFYAVDRGDDFETYKGHIVCGLIKAPYYDIWQLSAGISGAWVDISGLVSGDSLGVNPGDISGLVFMSTSEGGLLAITPQCYFPGGMSNITSGAYISYYNSTISGDLSGYHGAFCDDPNH